MLESSRQNIAWRAVFWGKEELAQKLWDTDGSWHVQATLSECGKPSSFVQLSLWELLWLSQEGLAEG